MILKSLVLNGFKSFADKTEINFDPGVTGIVGPNGCGKSNVLDAVRWVLGETSAKSLRSSEMADVIFNGTKTRKAIGRAEVILTFKNCEKVLNVPQNEIAITRRVFRDGKSQYLLNNKICRQKDILDLFMNTGVGQVSYSILEQGKVDQILSSRPEERRTVLEEAAGISKFKSQRKEAMNKLELAESNLARMLDIKSEVDKQFESSKRQASKARRYKKLKEDISCLDVFMLKNEYSEMLNKNKNVTADIEAMKAQSEKVLSSLTKLEQEISTKSKELSNSQQTLEELKRQSSDFENKNFSANTQIKFNNERIEETKKNIEELTKEKSELLTKIKLEQEQLEYYNETESKLEKTIHDLQQELSKVETEDRFELTNKSALYEELNSKRKEIETIKNTLFKNASDLKNNKNFLENADAETNSCQQEITRLEENYLEKIRAKNKADEDAKETAHKIENLRTNIGKLEIQHNYKLQELKSTNSQIAELDKNLTSINSKIEILKSQIQRNNNVNNEEITQTLKPFEPKLLGNIIQSEKKYFPAIESYFAHILKSQVITKNIGDWNHWQELLERLAQANSNQTKIAIVFGDLLQSLNNEHNQQDLPTEAIAWLSEKISCQELPEIANLASRTALVDSIETAMRLKPLYPDLAFVSLDGSYIDHSGVVFIKNLSEQSDNNLGLLTINKEIEDLEKQNKELSEKLAKITQVKNDLDENIVKTSTEIESHKKRINQLNIAKVETNSKANMLLKESSFIREKINELRTKEKNISEKTQIANEENEKITNEEHSLKDKLNRLESNHAELNEKIQTIENKARQTSTACTELKLEITQHNRNKENNKNLIKNTKNRIAEHNKDLERKDEQRQSSEEKIKNCSQQNQRLQTELAQLLENNDSIKEQIGKTESRKQNEQSQLSQLNEKLQSLRKENFEFNSEISKKELSATQTQVRLDNISEKVKDLYSIDIESAKPEKDKFIEVIFSHQSFWSKELNGELGKVEQVNQENFNPFNQNNGDKEKKIALDLLENLRQRLNNIGSVNLDALEEFAKLEQRSAFLEEQINDLEKAKEQLIDIIEKINITSRKKFKETFAKVRQNFQSMFVSLFGKGSSSDLLLLDEKEPLECGIEIKAQPRGKSLQSIRLLSGGERSMTAIALLFAIYMVKPSPFCILDELDAPLDDANIDRFLKAIDHFVQKSQFILITHNKRTMNKANVLHGVTMQELGVSKLISMELAKNNAEIDFQNNRFQNAQKTKIQAKAI